MNLTVSYPVRIAAICGLAGALAIGGGLMVLGRHGGTTTASAPVAIKPHPFGPGVLKHHRTTALHAHSGTVAKHAAKHATTAAKAPAVKVRKAERPAINSAALAAGLPVSLARALAQHQVVVVQIYDPQSEVDAIAYAEAQAGARDAGTGFLPLSVLGADVNKLTQNFGEVLPDPGILVYSRPAKLAFRIDGFVDRETVAQAAENAVHGT